MSHNLNTIPTVRTLSVILYLANRDVYCLSLLNISCFNITYLLIIYKVQTCRNFNAVLTKRSQN